jgi:hypothetical protein
MSWAITAIETPGRMRSSSTVILHRRSVNMTSLAACTLPLRGAVDEKTATDQNPVLVGAGRSRSAESIRITCSSDYAQWTSSVLAMLSEVRSESAAMVNDGLTAADDTNTLPSTTNRFSTSWERPVGSTTESAPE